MKLSIFVGRVAAQLRELGQDIESGRLDKQSVLDTVESLFRIMRRLEAELKKVGK